MTAIHGRKAQVLLTSSPSLSMTNQALTNSGDNTTYTMTGTPARRYWDRTATFTFETSTDGSTWTPATPVSVRYINGRVTFSGAVGGTHQARIASGKYWPYAAVVEAREWTPDIARDVKESTVMTTNNTPTQWRTFIGGLLDGSFKLSQWLADDTYFQKVSSETVMIAGLVIDVTSGARLDCECLITKDSLKIMLDDLEEEDLEFKITGPVYFSAS
jgi:hypothetical protein